MFEIGRICMKTAGREAGKVCVVVGKDSDKEFVLVTGPRIVTNVRRRKCNVRHLEPTPLKLGVKENATDSEVMKAYEKDGVYGKLKLHKPTPEDMKLAEEAAARHKDKPKQEKKKEEPKKEEKKEKPKEHKKEEKKHEKKEHKVEKKERKTVHKKKEAPKKEHKEKKKESKPKKKAARKTVKKGKK